MKEGGRMYHGAPRARGIGEDFRRLMGDVKEDLLSSSLRVLALRRFVGAVLQNMFVAWGIYWRYIDVEGKFFPIRSEGKKQREWFWLCRARYSTPIPFVLFMLIYCDNPNPRPCFAKRSRGVKDFSDG
mmetsp:Transcript_6688/g.13391  ORF Transcript_6688/g.13391 Transcript_6688/m.13391 type:complete len:128 (+) Transcript_6688:603-986(+)